MQDGGTKEFVADMKETGSILEEAQAIIYGDREKTYGDPSKNLALIAAYWSKHISASLGDNISLTVDDVCVMMILLKLARLANDPQHRDSKVDTAGYVALMQRCQDVAEKKDRDSAAIHVGTNNVDRKLCHKYPHGCVYPTCDCPIIPAKAG